MTTADMGDNGWATAMRWIGRLLALVVAGLFAYFVIEFGAEVFPRLSWTHPQGMPLLIVLLLTVAGAFLAWRWEVVGGLMAVVGSLAIIALVCAGSGIDMFLCGLYFTLPLLLAGILYLGCYWRVKATTPTKST